MFSLQEKYVDQTISAFDAGTKLKRQHTYGGWEYSTAIS